MWALGAQFLAGSVIALAIIVMAFPEESAPAPTPTCGYHFHVTEGQADGE